MPSFSIAMWVLIAVLAAGVYLVWPRMKAASLLHPLLIFGLAYWAGAR